VLSGIERFALREPLGMGDLMTIEATIARRNAERLVAECRVHCDDRTAAEGILVVDLAPLGEALDPELVEGLWRELHGSA